MKCQFIIPVDNEDNHIHHIWEAGTRCVEVLFKFVFVLIVYKIIDFFLNIVFHHVLHAQMLGIITNIYIYIYIKLYTKMHKLETNESFCLWSVSTLLYFR